MNESVVTVAALGADFKIKYQNEGPIYSFFDQEPNPAFEERGEQREDSSPQLSTEEVFDQKDKSPGNSLEDGELCEQSGVLTIAEKISNQKAEAVYRQLVQVREEFGDEMEEFLWDGPSDSDEEIEEFLQHKSQFEKEIGVRYSKRGIIDFCESFLRQESSHNLDDPKTAKKWE